jgi:hypothetical protein
VRCFFQRPFCLALGLFVLAWTVHVPAQTPPKPDGTGTKEAATFEGAQGNVVQLKLGQNSWLMQLEPKAVITFTGTAETDFVELAKSPLMVRFRAEINTRQKKATAPVSEIEIVNLSEINKPGAVVDGLGGFAEQPKGPPPETQSLLITSPVSSYKNGELTLAGGIKVPVDPMAKVTVNLDGPAALLATPPQANTVITYKYFTKQPGRGILSRMESTGVEPLAAPKKPMPRATAATKAKEKAEPKPEEPKPDEAKPEEKKE